ncbi:canalicular multispecific organic anion transporter 2-like protein [Coemansia reversa NRRL 1564]|uniref:Canalicular multispecific organic anion transporter 2-like protein n=1 Tax=Coemansia reversa (strain ATCC 12441 / NRRL 1564) TaxID=763665 RepID=A0A2G5B1F3_COERN|nr:canalicular multispecific organic anion transporter 2-like protein [Coemansia reversa NRRL 1564]|eukprot:PIA12845.1 canalicular multispecific organic anion transporter 2-like protein [Coemansia reversa NRRL 1564]
MLAGIMRAPVSFFDVTPLGRIINRFSADLSFCDDILPSTVFGVTNNITVVLTTFAVIVVSMPPMLLLMIPLSFAYIYLQKRYNYSSRELERISSMMNSPVLAHFQEITDGVSTICAYGQQSRFMLESQKRLAQKIRSNISYNSLLRWLTLRLEFLGNAVTLGTCLWAIISLQYFGFNDAGLLGLVITYSLNVMGSLNWFIRDYAELENSMTHLERIVEYANLTPEAPTVIEDNRPKKEWPEQGLVEFKNFSMRYREGLDLVLKDLSFRILPRQKVGIVGRTGAGKSSMTLALFRIVEAAGGQILLDGEDIIQYGLFDVRSKLAVIPQDPLLFAGTLRENLDPFNNYTDQDIWRALEQAHLAEYIRSKDERLQFVVTHKGDNFSAGQKQLICLARALLKQAKVLMLDEATAAIDIATDAIIQHTIRNEFKNCTVLTIAHRLETITDSDMILVIDAGRLAEYDTPQNLLANKNSLFAKLLEKSHTL